MPSVTWEEIRDVLDAALELAAEARPAYLDRACPQASLRRCVESLIRSYDEATNFLEEPAAARYPHPIEFDEGGSRTGRRLGAYLLIELVGQGGMGEVYRAVRDDDQYQKQVAIKLVRRGFDSRFTLERFRTERQILANLEHPNITRLLDGVAACPPSVIPGRVRAAVN
jgi:serine/threonine protein kinase